VKPVKPYQQMAIAECNEPLVPLLASEFSLVLPHPYAQLGAPYGDKSPFFVRQGVRDRLLMAQTRLQAIHPGWQIQVFDAYRPIGVQQFMVDYTFEQLVRTEGLEARQLGEAERQAFLDQVYEFWAVPNSDPALPPPHSTGAAIDVTLVDGLGIAIAMGSPIDEVSPRSYPQHFATNSDPQAQQFHAARSLLLQVMTGAGFTQHPNEWWHFSFGDQMWAWLQSAAGAAEPTIARYGGVR
jgi:zinc D-Ala-D-Ala dipeptidase